MSDSLFCFMNVINYFSYCSRSHGKPVLAAYRTLTDLLINYDANLNVDQLQNVVCVLFVKSGFKLVSVFNGVCMAYA